MSEEHCSGLNWRETKESHIEGRRIENPCPNIVSYIFSRISHRIPKHRQRHV
ncbi:hypothetical protein AAZX31_05G074400 [Glycine max]